MKQSFSAAKTSLILNLAFNCPCWNCTFLANPFQFRQTCHRTDESLKCYTAKLHNVHVAAIHYNHTKDHYLGL